MSDYLRKIAPVTSELVDAITYPEDSIEYTIEEEVRKIKERHPNHVMGQELIGKFIKFDKVEFGKIYKFKLYIKRLNDQQYECLAFIRTPYNPNYVFNSDYQIKVIDLFNQSVTKLRKSEFIDELNKEIGNVYNE